MRICCDRKKREKEKEKQKEIEMRFILQFPIEKKVQKIKSDVTCKPESKITIKSWRILSVSASQERINKLLENDFC